MTTGSTSRITVLTDTMAADTSVQLLTPPRGSRASDRCCARFDRAEKPVASTGDRTRSSAYLVFPSLWNPFRRLGRDDRNVP